jgi:hypothetical protein
MVQFNLICFIVATSLSSNSPAISKERSSFPVVGERKTHSTLSLKERKIAQFRLPLISRWDKSQEHGTFRSWLARSRRAGRLNLECHDTRDFAAICVYRVRILGLGLGLVT